MIFQIVLQCLVINLAYSISDHPILIIVSYDAFRNTYLNTDLVPHMNNLRRQGTYADYLINVFPTKTFPNHHSIATGLYSETHGVIGNSYLDPVEQNLMKMSYDLFHYNSDIVPIYRRNEDLGNGRYSGVMMWPGGVFPYQGKNVTYTVDFDPSYDWFKRVDTVISWLKDPVKPANLIMFYIEEPDVDSHIFGPESDVVHNLLRKLDNVTHYLDEQLKNSGLADKANVIHLSDHGMLTVKYKNLINVTQYLTPNTYVRAGASPVLQFAPKKGFEKEVYENLKNASGNGHFKVYKKSELLDRWHYKNNPRTPPILVMADVGYGLDDLLVAANRFSKSHNILITNETTFGVHGYDYIEKSMRPFFMARGPAIKTAHKVAPFESVDLYNLFCEILGIPSLENNGTVANIRDILNKGNGKYSLTSILVISAGGIFIAIILISCSAAITLLMIKRQQSITTTAALNKRFPQTFHSNVEVEAQHLLEPEDA